MIILILVEVLSGIKPEPLPYEFEKIGESANRLISLLEPASRPRSETFWRGTFDTSKVKALDAAHGVELDKRADLNVVFNLLPGRKGSTSSYIGTKPTAH